jgi:hypothetical protein
MLEAQGVTDPAEPPLVHGQGEAFAVEIWPLRFA